jgi:signal transduction histidine kinase
MARGHGGEPEVPVRPLVVMPNNTVGGDRPEHLTKDGFPATLQGFFDYALLYDDALHVDRRGARPPGNARPAVRSVLPMRVQTSATRIEPTLETVARLEGSVESQAILEEPRRWRTHRRLSVALGDVTPRYVLGVALVAALYFGAAKAGYVAGFSGPVAAIVWLPVGVGIACLYLGGPQLWPGVVLGDLLANSYASLPVGVAISQTCGNLAEVLLAAVLLRRWVGQHRAPIGNLGALGRVLLALAAGTLVSATVGALALGLGDVAETREIPVIWRTWWLGDLSGALLVVPLVLAWHRPPARRWLNERRMEALLLLGTVCVVDAVALRSDRPLSYLVFPGLIWAALRFGQRGATVAITVSAGVAVWNTTHYEGSFSYREITHAVLQTQLFIVVAAVSTLALAALVTEREEVVAQLAESHRRLLDVSEIERRRIERNIHDGAQQRLIALLIKLHLASERVDVVPAQRSEFFASAEADLQLAIDELRELAHGVHPSVVTALGLADALKSIAAVSTVPIVLHELPSTRLNATVEATAYYVVAEAVANARKYAHARSIHVTASVDRSVLYVLVVDDGVGGAAESAGSGLAGLRQRVEALGGTFEVISFPGRGTRLVCRFPDPYGSRQTIFPL